MISNIEHLKSLIRDIPDFPQPGILFRDVTTLLADAQAFSQVIELLAEHYADADITHICAVEARGYIFGAPLAARLGKGFIPVRKPGKLPAETISEAYSLEYGKNVLEVHKDAADSHSKVLIIDDLIATGGSARAAARLMEKLGAKVVGLGFIIELCDLKGREVLSDYDVYSLLRY